MSSREPPNRDQQIADALRALDVPEHDGDFFRRLDQKLARVGTRRSRASRLARRRSLLAVALVGVAVAASVFFVIRNSWVEQAEAAKVRSRVAAALASIRTIEGDLTYRALDPQTRR